MKALAFLDYYFALENDLMRLYPTIEMYKELERKAYAYREFVSLPFEPEIILSVFEGCVSNTDSTGRVYVFTKSNGSMFFVKNKEGALCNCLFPIAGLETKPQTLNDFISDCTRAGIELEFKKEIAEKLQ